MLLRLFILGTGRGQLGGLRISTIGRGRAPTHSRNQGLFLTFSTLLLGLKESANGIVKPGLSWVYDFGLLLRELSWAKRWVLSGRDVK